MRPLFQDRFDAGHQLARRLTRYARRADVSVLGLPRGGVPVAYEIARELGVPLDVFLVRKLGVPGHEELAMGAVASGGVRVLNEDVLEGLEISNDTLDAVTEQEMQELWRRERVFRDDRPPVQITGRTIILVDDGLATGSTARAAIAAVRMQHPARLIMAVPVAAPQICSEIGREVDEIVCLATPEPFYAVGLWYEDFSQTEDEEVHTLLRDAQQFARQQSLPTFGDAMFQQGQGENSGK